MQATIETLNPATQAVLANYTLLTQAEVATRLEQGHQAQLAWAKTPLATRVSSLRRLAEGLRQRENEFAALITAEMGKPITQALAEIQKCARLCDYYAQKGPDLLAPQTVLTDYARCYVIAQPLGILLAIMPWNFPFWQVMRCLAPALLLGNGVILKHAPNTYGCGRAIAELVAWAGCPEHLLQSIEIEVELVPWIIQHPLVRGVTLTGSPATGRLVAQQAGAALKKTVLELGGSDPYVILADADLERAAEQCVLSRLSNAGQICIAAKRLIVVEAVYAQFIEILLRYARAYGMGDPTDPLTKLGPMARADLRARVHAQVEQAIAQGARCVLGGELPTSTGFYYPATVLVDVPRDSVVFNEEVFGPVLAVISARDTAEAMQLANQTPFGLAGAVFTRDLAQGEALARDGIEAGCVAVNMLVSSDPRLPFGGVKESGYGRELGQAGLFEFANLKTVTLAG